MLKVSIFEFFFRAIPEVLLLIFSIYIFSFKNINVKRLLFSGIVLSIISWLIRLLPILPGVHTLILIPIFVLFANVVNEITLIKSVSSTVLSIITLSICEIINVYILTYVFHINTEVVFENDVLKTFYGIISLVLYLGICLLIYFTIYKKRIKLKN